MPKIRDVSSSKSLTDSNPGALAASKEQKENTDPMHDQDRPLIEMRSKQVNPDPVEAVMDPNTDDDPEVQSMLYDPIDQDHTSWESHRWSE
ncbi:MAG TPA: hypothetical protein VHR47_06505 [Bacillota bacterium]|nr:hypothetical protein [Bacillota bacterium]